MSTSQKTGGSSKGILATLIGGMALVFGKCAVMEKTAATAGITLAKDAAILERSGVMAEQAAAKAHSSDSHLWEHGEKAVDLWSQLHTKDEDQKKKERGKLLWPPPPK